MLRGNRRQLSVPALLNVSVFSLAPKIRCTEFESILFEIFSWSMLSCKVDLASNTKVMKNSNIVEGSIFPEIEKKL